MMVEDVLHRIPCSPMTKSAQMVLILSAVAWKVEAVKTATGGYPKLDRSEVRNHTLRESVLDKGDAGGSGRTYDWMKSLI